MSLRIVILPSAKSDIQFAFTWYESQQPNLGQSFKEEVMKAIDSILRPAKGFAPVYMSLSMVFVKKFHYVIYFKIDAVREQLVIYAVLSEKQDRNRILGTRL